MPADHLEAKRMKRLDRFGQFSVVAARMAMEDGHLDLDGEDRERVGASMGSALGGVAYAEAQLPLYLAGGLRAVDPALALAVFGGASSCNIAIELGVMGPNTTNGMSCASGTIAIGDAFRQIRDGYADVMFAGGAEAPLAPLCFGAFALIRAMSVRNEDPATASRPFDVGRDGFVMGEGSAILLLEERERAVSRGARIYAEVAGYGTTSDAHHMTAPRPDGSQAARAMRMALADAHVAPHEIGYINAHGSSTPLNDPTESIAIASVFGDNGSRIPVSGTKGYYGHALGASGAFEAAICALALEQEWLPPTVNLANPDPVCNLDYIQGAGRSARVDRILTNSFGFGGINACLVLQRAS
jgi:3-oxoacyl-[acyl-carrier-protein] synthase II